MKNNKRIWILSMFVLVLVSFIVEAAIPGVSLIRNVAGRLGDSTFRYMFFAVGLITFYYINKNFQSMGNAYVKIGIAAFLSYMISSWRLRTDGMEAYLYILLACMTLKARKSSGENDRVAGIDSGLMYAVAAGVMAPFTSIASGAEVGNAFFTHFLIGVGFPVIVAPIKEMLFGKNTEQGEGLFGMWKKSREEKKKKDQEEKDKIEARKKQAEHEEKEANELDKGMDVLEKKEKEIYQQPTNIAARQELAEISKNMLPVNTHAPIQIIVGNTQKEVKEVNEELDVLRDAISKLEKDFANTPKGKAARYINAIKKKVEPNKGKYDFKYWGEVFGTNWNNDSKFNEGLARYCDDKGIFRDVRKRLNKVKIKKGDNKGRIEPSKFIGFASNTVHDYLSDRERVIDILKGSLSKKVHKGQEVVFEAKDIEIKEKEVNERIKEDSAHAAEINKNIEYLRENIKAISDPNTPLDIVKKIIYKNSFVYKKVHGDLKQEVANERKLSDELNELKKVLDDYFEKEKEYDELTTVDEMQGLSDAEGYDDMEEKLHLEEEVKG